MVAKDACIYVAGHTGLVGSAILRELEKQEFQTVITATSSELDLRDPKLVRDCFSSQKIDYVYVAAAKVGGIMANYTQPADFIYDNLMIQTNLIHYSYKFGIKKLVFLGSSCIYPRMSSQPIKEEYFLDGKLEETNKAYAVAKIAGITMSQAYWKQYGFKAISLMPTNLYGSFDNFDLETSHVLPALIRKFNDAKKNDKKFVEVWGTGTPRREFLFVDDLANASCFLLENYESPEIINVGTGNDISIKELAYLIREIVGFKGEIHFDTKRPDGTPRKLLDTSRITELGWKPKFSLKEGITLTYKWFKNNY
jgi:GDP-L-fucose synthase